MSGYAEWMRKSTHLVVGFELHGDGAWVDERLARIHADGRLARFDIGHDDERRLFGIAVPLDWSRPSVAEADPDEVARAFVVVNDVMDACGLDWVPMCRVVMDGG